VSTRDSQCTYRRVSTRGVGGYTRVVVLLYVHSDCLGRENCFKDEPADTQSRHASAQTGDEVFHKLLAQLSSCLSSISDSPNHQPRAQIHRRPAGTKTCTPCSKVNRYRCGRLLPAFSRPTLPKRAYLLLCCRVRGHHWLFDISETLACACDSSQGESSEIGNSSNVGSKCSQTAESPGVVMPHHRVTPSDSAQKNNHRKGQHSLR
jgi:hypothetical protein